jgi:predicted ArsR family transcriptional regulator
LNRREIFGVLYRNHSVATLDAALDRLWQDGKARREQQVRTARGGGRPAEMWFATQHD